MRDEDELTNGEGGKSEVELRAGECPMKDKIANKIYGEISYFVAKTLYIDLNILNMLFSDILEVQTYCLLILK